MLKSKETIKKRTVKPLTKVLTVQSLTHRKVVYVFYHSFARMSRKVIRIPKLKFENIKN